MVVYVASVRGRPTGARTDRSSATTKRSHGRWDVLHVGLWAVREPERKLEHIEMTRWSWVGIESGWIEDERGQPGPGA